jgi:hypothetical protein
MPTGISMPPKLLDIEPGAVIAVMNGSPAGIAARRTAGRRSRLATMVQASCQPPPTLDPGPDAPSGTALAETVRKASPVPDGVPMTSPRQSAARLALLCLCAATAGCLPMHRSATSSLPLGADPQTRQLAVLKDDLDNASAVRAAAPSVTRSTGTVTQLTGLGFAQVSRQPGHSLNQRRILAMRAARMEAMRDLVEQIHGLKLSSNTTVKDAVLRDDVLRGKVDGEIRGARTVRITPKGSDSFEVVLAIDPDTVRYIVKAARGY